MVGPTHTRRCCVCTLTIADHTPSRLVAAGVNWHQYDPGERRKAEPRPRRTVWTEKRRQRYRGAR